MRIYLFRDGTNLYTCVTVRAVSRLLVLCAALSILCVGASLLLSLTR